MSIGLFLYAVSVIVIAVVVWLPIFGLVCAPVATLICVIKARTRGLSAVPYAIAAAAYSVLFFLSWIYLIARMYGRSFPRAVVSSVYFVLYGVVWGLGSITLNWILASASIPRLEEISIVLLIANIITWIASLTLLLHFTSRDKERQRVLLDDALLGKPYSEAKEQVNELKRDSLPHFVFILPFALALTWLIITLVLFGMQM